MSFCKTCTRFCRLQGSDSVHLGQAVFMRKVMSSDTHKAANLNLMLLYMLVFRYSMTECLLTSPGRGEAGMDGDEVHSGQRCICRSQSVFSIELFFKAPINLWDHSHSYSLLTYYSSCISSTLLLLLAASLVLWLQVQLRGEQHVPVTVSPILTVTRYSHNLTKVAKLFSTPVAHQNHRASPWHSRP